MEYKYRLLHHNTTYYKNIMGKAKKGHKVDNATRIKLSDSHIGKNKGLTWKVIDGKRVWLPKEGV